MTETLRQEIVEGLVKKLKHEIKDIRLRSIDSLYSKLMLDLVEVNDLISYDMELVESFGDILKEENLEEKIYLSIYNIIEKMTSSSILCGTMMRNEKFLFQLDAHRYKANENLKRKLEIIVQKILEMKTNREVEIKSSSFQPIDEKRIEIFKEKLFFENLLNRIIGENEIDFEEEFQFVIEIHQKFLCVQNDLNEKYVEWTSILQLINSHIQSIDEGSEIFFILFFSSIDYMRNHMDFTTISIVQICLEILRLSKTIQNNNFFSKQLQLITLIIYRLYRELSLFHSFISQTENETKKIKEKRILRNVMGNDGRELKKNSNEKKMKKKNKIEYILNVKIELDIEKMLRDIFQFSFERFSLRQFHRSIIDDENDSFENVKIIVSIERGLLELIDEYFLSEIGLLNWLIGLIENDLKYLEKNQKKFSLKENNLNIWLFIRHRMNLYKRFLSIQLSIDGKMDLELVHRLSMIDDEFYEMFNSFSIYPLIDERVEMIKRSFIQSRPLFQLFRSIKNECQILKDDEKRCIFQFKRFRQLEKKIDNLELCQSFLQSLQFIHWLGNDDENEFNKNSDLLSFLLDYCSLMNDGNNNLFPIIINLLNKLDEGFEHDDTSSKSIAYLTMTIIINRIESIINNIDYLTTLTTYDNYDSLNSDIQLSCIEENDKQSLKLLPMKQIKFFSSPQILRHVLTSKIFQLNNLNNRESTIDIFERYILIIFQHLKNSSIPITAFETHVLPSISISYQFLFFHFQRSRISQFIVEELISKTNFYFTPNQRIRYLLQLIFISQIYSNSNDEIPFKIINELNKIIVNHFSHIIFDGDNSHNIFHNFLQQFNTICLYETNVDVQMKMLERLILSSFILMSNNSIIPNHSIRKHQKLSIDENLSDEIVKKNSFDSILMNLLQCYNRNITSQSTDVNELNFRQQFHYNRIDDFLSIFNLSNDNGKIAQRSLMQIEEFLCNSVELRRYFTEKFSMNNLNDEMKEFPFSAIRIDRKHLKIFAFLHHLLRWCVREMDNDNCLINLIQIFLKQTTNNPNLFNFNYQTLNYYSGVMESTFKIYLYQLLSLNENTRNNLSTFDADILLQFYQFSSYLGMMLKFFSLINPNQLSTIPSIVQSSIRLQLASSLQTSTEILFILLFFNDRHFSKIDSDDRISIIDFAHDHLISPINIYRLNIESINIPLLSTLEKSFITFKTTKVNEYVRQLNESFGNIRKNLSISFKRINSIRLSKEEEMMDNRHKSNYILTIWSNPDHIQIVTDWLNEFHLILFTLTDSKNLIVDKNSPEFFWKFLFKNFIRTIPYDQKDQLIYIEFLKIIMNLLKEHHSSFNQFTAIITDGNGNEPTENYSSFTQLILAFLRILEEKRSKENLMSMLKVYSYKLIFTILQLLQLDLEEVNYSNNSFLNFNIFILEKYFNFLHLLIITTSDILCEEEFIIFQSTTNINHSQPNEKKKLLLLLQIYQLANQTIKTTTEFIKLLEIIDSITLNSTDSILFNKIKKRIFNQLLLIPIDRVTRMKKNKIFDCHLLKNFYELIFSLFHWRLTTISLTEFSSIISEFLIKKSETYSSNSSTNSLDSSTSTNSPSTNNIYEISLNFSKFLAIVQSEKSTLSYLNLNYSGRSLKMLKLFELNIRIFRLFLQKIINFSQIHQFEQFINLFSETFYNICQFTFHHSLPLSVKLDLVQLFPLFFRSSNQIIHQKFLVILFEKEFLKEFIHLIFHQLNTNNLIEEKIKLNFFYKIQFPIQRNLLNSIILFIEMTNELFDKNSRSMIVKKTFNEFHSKQITIQLGDLCTVNHFQNNRQKSTYFNNVISIINFFNLILKCNDISVKIILSTIPSNLMKLFDLLIGRRRMWKNEKELELIHIEKLLASILQFFILLKNEYDQEDNDRTFSKEFYEIFENSLKILKRFDKLQNFLLKIRLLHFISIFFMNNSFFHPQSSINDQQQFHQMMEVQKRFKDVDMKPIVEFIDGYWNEEEKKKTFNLFGRQYKAPAKKLYNLMHKQCTRMFSANSCNCCNEQKIFIGSITILTKLSFVSPTLQADLINWNILNHIMEMFEILTLESKVDVIDKVTLEKLIGKKEFVKNLLRFSSLIETTFHHDTNKRRIFLLFRHQLLSLFITLTDGNDNDNRLELLKKLIQVKMKSNFNFFKYTKTIIDDSFRLGGNFDDFPFLLLFLKFLSNLIIVKPKKKNNSDAIKQIQQYSFIPLFYRCMMTRLMNNDRLNERSLMKRNLLLELQKSNSNFVQLLNNFIKLLINLSFTVTGSELLIEDNVNCFKLISFVIECHMDEMNKSQITSNYVQMNLNENCLLILRNVSLHSTTLSQLLLSIDVGEKNLDISYFMSNCLKIFLNYFYSNSNIIENCPMDNRYYIFYLVISTLAGLRHKNIRVMKKLQQSYDDIIRLRSFIDSDVTLPKTTLQYHQLKLTIDNYLDNFN
ncbi:hypothetical protein SNEBB_008742 [Seison nebaliae]|nr:hypothetical protein SNEBB_008742 [Seison nebaliae]